MSPLDEDKSGDAAACAVCERRLLPGEHPLGFVTSAGAEVTVCELCKPRAEAAGWLRPGQAGALPPSAGTRRRRQRGSLLGGLRARGERGIDGRAERRAERLSGRAELPAIEDPDTADRPVEGQDEPTSARAERPTTAGSQVAAGGRSAAGPDVSQAVAAFNASEFRRTVAGLSRSLGSPQATAIAIRTAAGANGARLTIAWDLAWYQWEVGPGKRKPEIRQTGKGETLEQLRAADRNWNVDVGEDGTLKRRAGASA